MFFWSWILIQNTLVQYCQSQAFRNHESDTRTYETGWHFKFKKKVSFVLLFLVSTMVTFLSFCWQPWKQTLNQCTVLLFWMKLHCYVRLDFSSSGTKKSRCCMTCHKNHPIWQQLLIVQLQSEHFGTHDLALILKCLLIWVIKTSHYASVPGGMKRVNSLYPKNYSKSHLLLFEMIQNHISSQYSWVFLSGFNCKPYAKNALVIWILDWVKNASLRSKQNLREMFPSDL